MGKPLIYLGKDTTTSLQTFVIFQRQINRKQKETVLITII